MHYTRLAKEGIESALGRLEEWQAAHSRTDAGGGAALEALQGRELAVLAADARLARDKLRARITAAEQRLAANKVEPDTCE